MIDTKNYIDTILLDILLNELNKESFIDSLFAIYKLFNLIK
ncbi:MAG: hypothetical protein WDA47_07440 [Bacilli bacterium]